MKPETVCVCSTMSLSLLCARKKKRQEREGGRPTESRYSMQQHACYILKPPFPQEVDRINKRNNYRADSIGI